MKIYSELNGLRMSPRKVRLVSDAIRGKRYPEAERILRFLTRRASSPMEKLLRSAAANAKSNFQINDPATLIVSDVRVDAGPTMKRQRARARGRAALIRKRTSRIILTLESTGEITRPKKAKAQIEIIREAEGGDGAGERVSKSEFEKPERERVKTPTKPTGFVQRMFRRKAI